jgi:regulator of replication initiation timing
MVDSATLTALSALVAAVATAGVTYMTTRNKARSDEVSLLRDEVTRLHKQTREQKDEWEAEREELRKEIASLRKENAEGRIENAKLYRVLRKHGIDVEAETASA